MSIENERLSDFDEIENENKRAFDENQPLIVTDIDVDEVLDTLLKSHPNLNDLKNCLKKMFNIEANPLWEKAKKYSIKYGCCVIPVCDKRTEDGKCSCDRDYPSLFGCEVFECLKLKEEYEDVDMCVDVLTDRVLIENYEEKAYDKIKCLLPYIMKNACRYHSFTKRFGSMSYDGPNDDFKKIVDEYFSFDYVIIRKLLRKNLIEFCINS